jgi:hypothetical protein
MFFRSKKRLVHPSREQQKALRYKEDWAFFVLEHNPSATPSDVIRDYNYTNLGKRLGWWSDAEMNALHGAVRAGGEQRAQLEQTLAAEQALRDRQAQCKTWDDWVREYIKVHPEAGALTISTELEGASLQYNLGDEPTLERIDELRAELGALTPEALQAKAAEAAENERVWQAKLLEKLRVLPAQVAARGKPKLAQARNEAPHLNVKAFETALAQAHATQAKSELSPQTRDFISAFELPAALCDFFVRFNFADGVQFGRMHFHGADDLWRENLLAEHCLKLGLLIAGSTETGDPIALAMDTWTVGYINHEDMWSGMYELEGSWVDTGLDLGTFFFAAATHKKFPVDFYAAKKTAKKFSKFARA